ncbi:MAG: hypothetical protein M1828_007525 [Chrysothrix sp. TS-e1954]|nr:MAG: hypothetical protein M1828_007525 [Chrysothrix sp. TS-e1954]
MASGHWRSVDLCEIQSDEFTVTTIYRGDCVELKSRGLQESSNDFLRVQRILQNHRTGDTTLRGLLCKTKARFGTLFDVHPKDSLNELVMSLNIAGDVQYLFKDSTVSVNIRQVLRKRQAIFTNYAFPSFSYQTNEKYLHLLSDGVLYEEERLEIAREGPLVCRWVCEQIYGTETERDKGERCSETTIRHFTPKELKELNAPSHRIQKVKELIENFVGRIVTTLTFADLCCGSGNVCRAAKSANLIVIWANDADESIRATFRFNHPGIDLHLGEYQNLRFLGDDLIVTILHISLPCQFLSRANTMAGTKHHSTPGGRRDESNSALLLGLEHLLLKVRPRVVTLEQSDALVSLARNRPYFEAIIASFTNIGYSVRWKIVDFADYGSCQHRKRFILYGSCPGQDLPSFPKPTHGPGLRPFKSISQAIGTIPPNHPEHHPKPLANGRRTDAPDANGQLRHIITTSGTLDCHPNGKRHYSIAELDHMQGGDVKYPVGLSDGAKKRMSGNGVPSDAFVPFLLEAKKAILMTNDAIRREDAVYVG